MEQLKKINFKDFIDKVSSYIEDTEQLELIKTAYNYILEYYGDKQKDTGETYIDHSLDIA